LGSDLWTGVGHWANERLGFSDGGPGYVNDHLGAAWINADAKMVSLLIGPDGVSATALARETGISQATLSR
jgi:hypothetical protein